MSRPAAQSTARTQKPAEIAAPALPSLLHELGVAGGLFALTGILFAWIFPSAGIWPATFVCLTPWTIGVCITHRAWIVHWMSFLTGWATFLWALRWLYPVTDMGFVALAFYLGIYWVLAAWGVRTARRYGVLAIASLPIVWVGCEYLRAWMLSGFPWLFLSHALYEQTLLIQISDITGAYGVSFLAAAVNAVIAEAVIRLIWKSDHHNKSHGRQFWFGVAGTAVLIAGIIGYGSQRATARDAPETLKVAVVQEDFLLSNHEQTTDNRTIFASYMAAAVAAAQQNPDLLILPETPWNSIQNIEYVGADARTARENNPAYYAFNRQCHDATSAFARGDYKEVNRVLEIMERQRNASLRGRDAASKPPPLPRVHGDHGPALPLVVGAVARTQTGAVEPPEETFNSAFVYDPNGSQRPQRYDKIHLVPFGEQVPFRYTRGLRWLYRWLNGLSPFSNGGRYEYSLTPGREFHVFELPVRGRTVRFGTPICYEDVMPYVSRAFAWDGANRRADFLVNISNDGWFNHSNELPQHLAICVFRAVENRVSIARAVNTGISALIDADGRVLARVEKDGVSQGPGVIGTLVGDIGLDTRQSFYGRFGDVFARVCLALSCLLWLQGVVSRWVLAIRNRFYLWRLARAAKLRSEQN